MSRRVGLALITVSLALLTIAWSMASRPFAAPDEASHYLRALSIANGSVLGRKVPYFVPGLTPAQTAWANQGTRAVTVPPRMSPPNVGCIGGRPDAGPGPCTEATEVGAYAPLSYALPALALTASSTASTGLWASRIVSAVTCLLFVALALALLWSGSPWSLIGPLSALTPMVLFVMSVVNPNGLEIAASLACAAAVLRIVRERSSPGWVWMAFAGSGAAAILAWQLGPVFVALDITVGVALLGAGALRDIRRGAARELAATASVLAAALVVYILYGVISSASHVHVGFSPLWSALHQGVDQLGPVVRDAAGTFGSLTVPLPMPARVAWWALVAGEVAVALALGSRRERTVLGAITVIALAFPVLFYAWVYRFTGFGMQGRYVLPILALPPLVAGEIIRRRAELARAVARTAWPAAALVMVIALIQGYAWWFNARTSAGAPGMIRFYAHAAWSPPLGWIVYIASAAVGVVLLLLYAGGLLAAGRILSSVPATSG